MKKKYLIGILFIILILAAVFAVGEFQDDSGSALPVKVLILPKFEVGEMSGDFPGEAQYYYEEYTRSLVTKLLFTDEIKDVHSDSDYPQFEYSNNAYRNIHDKFNSSQSGYL
jgi:hypothetical protein